jgi:hypothetical protein
VRASDLRGVMNRNLNRRLTRARDTALKMKENQGDVKNEVRRLDPDVDQM